MQIQAQMAESKAIQSIVNQAATEVVMELIEAAAGPRSNVNTASLR